MTVNTSADLAPLVSRNALGEAVSRALRLHVGRGRRLSVKQLANGTGVKDRVIECAMAEPDNADHRPLPGEALVSISRFLGPEFTTEWLRLADQGAFWLPDTDETPPGMLAADLCEDSARVSRRAADGEFCREDRHHLRPVGIRMMAIGAQLARAA